LSDAFTDNEYEMIYNGLEEARDFYAEIVEED
jgi:hypothetical protein